MKRRALIPTLIVVALLGLAGCTSNGLSVPNVEQSVVIVERPQSDLPQSDLPQSEIPQSEQSSPTLEPANTVEQSCQMIFDAQEGGASLPAGNQPSSEDMQRYVDETRATAERIDATISQVSDPEVQAAAEALRDALSDMADAMQHVYVEQNSDYAGQFESANTEYSNATEQLYAICMPGSIG